MDWHLYHMGGRKGVYEIAHIKNLNHTMHDDSDFPSEWNQDLLADVAYRRLEESRTTKLSIIFLQDKEDEIAAYDRFARTMAEEATQFPGWEVVTPYNELLWGLGREGYSSEFTICENLQRLKAGVPDVAFRFHGIQARPMPCTIPATFYHENT